MVKVNFGEIEEYKALDPGTYHFVVTDTDIDQHKDTAKHPGNDFWKLTLTVQDGPKAGKTQNLMCTLPPYEPFTLVSILRATIGQHRFSEDDVKTGDVDVNIEDLDELEFVATVRKQKNSDYDEVRNIRPYEAESWDPGDDELP